MKNKNLTIYKNGFFVNEIIKKQNTKSAKEKKRKL